MDAIVPRKSAKRIGHFQLHSALVIGHKELPGVQVHCPTSSVLSFPLQAISWGAPIGPAFVRPPGARDLRLSIDSVVLQSSALFSFQAETDTGMKVHNCAFAPVLWEYDEKSPRYLIDLHASKKI